MEDKKTEQETVGYGNPPKETQFKKGQSGNRRGRPKGSKNTHTLIQQVLNQKITIKENGNSVRITKKQAMLTHAINKGVKGDLKAIGLLFPHILTAEFKEEEKNRILSAIGRNDQDILNNYIKDINKEPVEEIGDDGK